MNNTRVCDVCMCVCVAQVGAGVVLERREGGGSDSSKNR